MKFTPKTEEELQEEMLLPAGEYPFEISGAEDGVSKSSGLDMIVLTVRVYKEDGNFNLITDYLSSSEKAQFKLRNICKAVGLIEKYDLGELNAEDFIGKSGMLKLKIQKDTSGNNYPDKNSVASYLMPEENKKTKVKKDALQEILEDNDDLEDEIPF